MNTINVEALLRSYNEQKQPTTIIDNTTEKRTGLISASYANPIDYFYDKYKGDQNFDIRLWQDSQKFGDLDKYIALLDKNRDTVLSADYKNPLYYDYDTMMLELYKNLEDDTLKTERFTEEYDPIKKDYNKVSLGEMTDKQYAEYQLNLSRDFRSQEINKYAIQWRKDNMNFGEKLGTGAIATTAELGEGVVASGAGLLDTAATIVSGGLIPWLTYDKSKGGNYLDAIVDYFGQNGLLAAERDSLRAALDRYEIEHTIFKDVDGNMTNIGKFFGGMANSIGMMVPAMVVTATTGGLGAPSRLGTATFYGGSFAMNVYDNANNPYTKNSPSWLKLTNAAVVTAGEVAVEYALGKLLGSTLQNSLIGMKTGNFSTKILGNLEGRAGLKYMFKSAAQEGLEEVLQDTSTALVNSFSDMIYEGYGAEGLTLESLVDSFTIAFATSILLSGVGVAKDSVQTKIGQRITKDSTYNEIYIEKDGKLQAAKGLNKQYYKAILGDFYDAFDSLSKTKTFDEKTTKLAQEVYTALSSMTQLYASLGTDRLAKAQKLLNRVVKADKYSRMSFTKAHKNDATEMSETEKQNVLNEMNVQKTKEFSDGIKEMLVKLTKGAYYKEDAMKKSIEAAIEKAKDTLNEGGTTQAVGVTDKEGNVESNITLTQKQKDTLKSFTDISPEYNFIVITDGHLAVEADGTLFVPQAWLEHYKTSEIYGLLNVYQVFEKLNADKDFQPVLKSISKFVRTFTGKKNMSKEETLMQFFFNSTVYQSFLFSESENNKLGLKYKDIVYRLFNAITQLSKEKGMSAERIKVYNDLREQLQDTMRLPTLKAIINWNMKPQEIGADAILTEKDREFLQKYVAHEKALRTFTGPTKKADYAIARDTIIRYAGFSSQELDVIRKAEQPNATQIDKNKAFLLLRFASEELPKKQQFVAYTKYFNKFQNFLNDKETIKKHLLNDANYKESKTKLDYRLQAVSDAVTFLLEDFEKQLSVDLVAKLDKISESLTLYSLTPSASKEVVSEIYEEILTAANSISQAEIDEIKKLISKRLSIIAPKSALMAFFIPTEALASGNTKEEIQKNADAINKFKETYGISVTDLLNERLYNLKAEKLQEVDAQKNIIGANTYPEFALLGLEKLLGDDYIVTEKRKIDDSITVPTEFQMHELRNWIKTMSRFPIGLDNLKTFFPGLKKLNVELPHLETMYQKSTGNRPEFRSYTHENQKELLTELLQLEIFIEKYEQLDRDFVILKKIPATKLLPRFILKGNAEQQGNNILNMPKYSSFLRDIINEDTGEVIGSESYECYKMSDFINSSNSTLKKKFSEWKIAFDEFKNENGTKSRTKGQTDTWNKTITISKLLNKDQILETLVHEMNHAIQYEYNITDGASSRLYEAYPEIIKKVEEFYSEVVDYLTRYLRKGNTELEKQYYEYWRREQAIYIAYTLNQGELLSEMGMESGGSLHGITEKQNARGWSEGHRIFGDNKLYDAKFVALEKSTKSKSEHVPEEFIHNSMATTFTNILAARANKDSRNTFHSQLTRTSTTDAISPFLKDSLSPLTRSKLTLNDLIVSPEMYLSEDIQMKIGELTEAKVYKYLRTALEAQKDGTSIDRDANTHNYILVDDRAFDDIYAKNVGPDDTTDLIDTNKDKKVVLSTFYDTKQLDTLGATETKVVISKDARTQTLMDKDNNAGTIFIQLTDNDTNASILEKLNHEFRHLLQLLYNFETGFTPNFKVSADMIRDVKAHVPEIFTDEKIVEWAKESGAKNIDEYITRHFVYYMVGGEINAYGISAKYINSKPAYVAYEAGKLTIFMPWYDAKSGTGRYKTQYLDSKTKEKKSAKKETVESDKTGGKGATLPSAKPRKAATEDELETQLEKEKRPRYFSKKKAEGTNLEYFIRKDRANQLDPDVQDFVIKTTDNEDKIKSKTLIKAIHDGVLTKQSLFKWFMTVEWKDLDDFTFNLLNETLFHNDTITNAHELEKIVSIKPQIYWAAAVVLRREGVSLQALIDENNVTKFEDFMTSIEGSKWYKKILEFSKNFATILVEDGVAMKTVELHEDMSKYMRAFAMRWFNGSLAGAFYTANAMRKMMRLSYEQNERNTISMDAKKSNSKGDKDTSTGETISEGSKGKKTSIASEIDVRRIGNDIEALYRPETFAFEEDMIMKLAMKKFEQDIEAAFTDMELTASERKDLQELYQNRTLDKEMKKLTAKDDLTEAEENRLQLIKDFYRRYLNALTETTQYQRELIASDEEDVLRIYADVMNADMMGITIERITDIATDKEGYLMDRAHIAARSKYYGKKIAKLLNSNKINDAQLSEDIKNMFNKTEKGYELSDEVYKVGRGPAVLQGTIEKGIKYSGKKNLADGQESQKHDVTQIANNEKLLRITWLSLKKKVIDDKNELDKLQRENKKLKTDKEKLQKKLDKKIMSNKIGAQDSAAKTASISAKSRIKGDITTEFNIVSNTAIPPKLEKMLSVSGEFFVSNRVQYVSQDESGKLYDRKDNKKVKANEKHELNSFTNLYENLREDFLQMTREEALEIIDFFETGAIISNGQSRKYAAYEIFVLGYILATARNQTSGWNFSQSEIDRVKQIYDDKGGAHGAGLQAMSQMLEVLDPYKIVHQRSLEDLGVSQEITKNFFDELNALQKETDKTKRKEREINVLNITKQMNEQMIDYNKAAQNDKATRTPFSERLMSYRFIAMLSSPATWIRNIISNILLTQHLKVADSLSGLIFKNKEMRKGQWDLANTKPTDEVNNYIEEFILKSPIFDPLFENTSRYDTRKKPPAEQRILFLSMMQQAVERKFLASNKFNTEAMNRISLFIQHKISDAKFIRNAAEKYFAKILTLEVQAGNVKLGNTLSNEVLNLFAESVLLANEDYIHTRTFFAEAMIRLRETSPTAYKVISLFQPFLNSAFAWFKESLRYTPAGLINSVIQMSKLEQTIDKVRAKRADWKTAPMTASEKTVEFVLRRNVGKGIIGTVFFVTGMLLSAFGILGFDDDDDTFYIEAGNLKVDISNLFASSSVLMGAAVASLFDKEKKNFTLLKTLEITLTEMFEGFILNDIIQRHKWDENFGETIMTESVNIAQSFVPQFVQLLMRAVNNQKRSYSDNLKGQMERWLSTFLPASLFELGTPNINVYTGEIQSKYSIPVLGEFLKSGMFGPKFYWYSYSDTEDFVRSAGLGKSQLTGALKIKDSKGNEKDHQLDKLKLNQYYGQLNSKTLLALRKQTHQVEVNGVTKIMSWSQLTDSQKASIIDKTMTQNAKLAKIYIWTQVEGKKYYASQLEYAQLRTSGIMTNVYLGGKGFVEQR